MTDSNAPGLALSFDVQIDGVSVATFTGCSGLSATYEAFEWKEGGDNGTVVRLPGRLSYGNVKLTRAVDSDSGKLAAWFSQQQQQPARKTAVIKLYDGNRSMVTSWTLEGAWPVCYSGPTLTTSEEGQAVAVESLELSHQGFSS
ncbi:MAG TPA: phage tail protein [Streptosporangiaceae bacterium]|nr:phage tail protein [Streptosporangiaceae bacterium]